MTLLSLNMHFITYDKVLTNERRKLHISVDAHNAMKKSKKEFVQQPTDAHMAVLDIIGL